jgi:hypothetical protein
LKACASSDRPLSASHTSSKDGKGNGSNNNGNISGGTGQQARHSKHLAASKEKKSSTHFYFMYPASHRKTQDKTDKLGCFELITHVIAAGFDPT